MRWELRLENVWDLEFSERNKMKHIIFDCDNTFGVKDCDVDDGLALLYLLGCKEAAKIHGITATYGNNRLEVVYETIHRMLKDLGREDIAVKRGGYEDGDYDSEAADYLAEMANRLQGQLSILATGSLTNLQGAYERDAHFFEKVKEIVLMGGITEPLVFEKKVMDELNFSCDPLASCNVLKYGNNVSVITGNHCLKVLFTKEEYKRELFSRKEPIARYIRERTDYWFGYNEADYGIKGFYNWDVTAAVYLMHPELFTEQRGRFAFSEEDLKTGYLRKTPEGMWQCNLPEIGDAEAFKRNIYDTWMKVKILV
jgi:Inosine-uridine nucleoside N-ribohydrolase